MHKMWLEGKVNGSGCGLGCGGGGAKARRSEARTKVRRLRRCCCPGVGGSRGCIIPGHGRLKSQCSHQPSASFQNTLAMYY